MDEFNFNQYHFWLTIRIVKSSRVTDKSLTDYTPDINTDCGFAKVGDFGSNEKKLLINFRTRITGKFS